MPIIKQKFYSNEVPANLTETGWTLGGTATNIAIGDIAWVNPSNVLVDSTSAAVATGTSNYDYTHKLRVTNFGFSIPSGATVTGIGFKIRRRCSSPNDVIDDAIQLVLSGTNVGANKATMNFWSNITETVEYGGTGDLWSWVSASYTNINNSTFGIDVSASDDATGLDTNYIEAVWLKIFYTV